MEKPHEYGAFVALFNRQWTGREVREIADEIEDLNRQPGFNRLLGLLDDRERMLVDRLVHERPDPEGVRGTDQVIGMIAGLRQLKEAADSILYAAQEARERAKDAAGEPAAESEIS